jgi:hypothetical protein
VAQFRPARASDRLCRTGAAKGEDIAVRILTLASAVAIACVALPALAQDQAPAPDQAQVHELPNDQVQSKVPAPPSVPGQDRTQDQTQVPPKPRDQLKSQERVEDKTPPSEIHAPPKTPSRYTFNRVKDGFLRLDNQTGQIAFCGPHNMGWVCEAVPEERAALEKEIARLQDEVADLKTQIATLRAPPQQPPEIAPPTPHAGRNDDAKIKLPTREELARAREFFDSAWRRMVEMIMNIQKDMMQKD